MKTRFFDRGGKDMVEMTHEADKNSVILPAEDAHRQQYPQEWATYQKEGKRHAHRASAQDTPKSEMEDDPDKETLTNVTSNRPADNRSPNRPAKPKERA